MAEILREGAYRQESIIYRDILSLAKEKSTFSRQYMSDSFCVLDAAQDQVESNLQGIPRGSQVTCLLHQ